MGYCFMLLPSILFSISLEAYRARPRASNIGYVTLGGALGGIASFLFIWINPDDSVQGILDAFMAFIFSICIGAAIPAVFCWLSKPQGAR